MSEAKGWGGMPPPWLAKEKKLSVPMMTSAATPWRPPPAPSATPTPAKPAAVTKPAPAPAPAVSKPAAAPTEITKASANARRFEPASEAYMAPPEQGPEPTMPEEVVDHHAELSRYHHQAMAHHFAMMYHHSNLAAEAYIDVMGPECDLRVYRPEIPEAPMLPDEWHAQYMLEGHSYAMTDMHRDYALNGKARKAAQMAKVAAAVKAAEDADHMDEGMGVDLEVDPQLTDEEQQWLNDQINVAITDHVERELEKELAADTEGGELGVPEMMCEDEAAPTTEEVERFMQQVDVLEAWSKPIDSMYVAKKSEEEGEQDTATAEPSGDAKGDESAEAPSVEVPPAADAAADSAPAEGGESTGEEPAVQSAEAEAVPEEGAAGGTEEAPSGVAAESDKEEEKQEKEQT